MATVNTLGADVLSLRGADEEYHRISRFFRTRAEAEAALVSEDWVPMAGVVNVCITGDEGILLYDSDRYRQWNAFQPRWSRQNLYRFTDLYSSWRFT